MSPPIPQFNKPLYLLYFVFGFLFSCVAIAIGITDRDGPGDLPQDFLIVGWTTIIGIVIGLITYFVVRSYELKNKIVYSLWIFIRYFLAFVFFNYGFIKVVGLQFGSSLSLFDMRVLDLSKSDMGVAWFFFGHSNAYEMFLGWGETIAAIFLLFRRTSVLGAAILLAIVSNVVAVNYWYDVPVKINSTYYLLMTLWVILFHYHRLVAFLIFDKAVENPVYPEFSYSPNQWKFIRFVKGMIILAIIGYSAYDNFYWFPKEYGYDKKSVLKGVWKVDEVNTELTDTQWTDKMLHAKFYLYDYGQGIIKNDYTVLSRFTYLETPDSLYISQLSYDSTYELKGVFRRDNELLEITGEWAKKATVMKLSSVPEYSDISNSEIVHKEIPVDTKELTKFVGKYKIASGYLVSLVLKNGRLFRITDNNPEAEMIPVGKNRFAYKGRPMYWQFHLSENGDIVDILYTTYGTDYTVWKLVGN